LIRSLDRYIFRELIVPFLIGTASVVLMFLANTLIHYSEQIFRKDVPWSAVGQLMLFSIPSTLKLTLPVGTAIATSLAVSRLVRESELTALRAAGIPIRRVLLPVIALGVLAAGMNLALVERVMPFTEIKFKDTLRKILMSAEAIGVRSNALLKFDDGRYHVSIAAIEKGAGGEIKLSGLFVFHQPKRGEYWFAMADSGNYKDSLLTLLRPQIYQFEGERLISWDVKDTHVISQRIGVDAFFGTALPEEQTASQLGKTVRELRQRGLADEARRYEVEFWNRFAIPFSCLVFALFSPIFAVKFSRGGPFVGVLISVIVVFVYYNVWILTSQVLANQHGLLPPIVGAWLPNLLFLLTAGVALWKSE
jgi:lipopolysaccharide export system permease protein